MKEPKKEISDEELLKKYKTAKEKQDYLSELALADISKHLKNIESGIVESELQPSELYLEVGKRAMEEKLLQAGYSIQEIGAKTVEGKLEPIGGYVRDRVKELYDDIIPPIKSHWNKVDQQEFNRVAELAGDTKKGAGYRYFIKDLYGDIPSTFHKAESMLLKEFDYDLIRKLSKIKIKQFAAGTVDDLAFNKAELITGIPKKQLKSFGFKPLYIPDKIERMILLQRKKITPEEIETIFDEWGLTPKERKWYKNTFNIKEEPKPFGFLKTLFWIGVAILILKLLYSMGC